MAGSSKAEVWIADMRGKGHEQKGDRPVILWRDLDHVKMAIIMPCTTTQDASKFPHTYLISQTPKNGLGEDSTALVFQITSIDKKRLLKKLGEVDAENIAGISAILKEMLRV